MVQDTWHNWSGSQCTTCQMYDESNMSSSGTHERHMASCHWIGIQTGEISG